jgi:hypothetical protein
MVLCVLRAFLASFQMALYSPPSALKSSALTRCREQGAIWDAGYDWAVFSEPGQQRALAVREG